MVGAWCRKVAVLLYWAGAIVTATAAHQGVSMGQRSHRLVHRSTGGSRSGSRLWVAGEGPMSCSPHARGPPVAMAKRISRGIGDYINRFKHGTSTLFANAKKIGPLRKRFNTGEQLTFEEYNLLQRTSGDIAKAVGLTFFTITKPEFAPIMMSFFPQVIPSTYLTPEDKIKRAQQNYYTRIKSSVEHILSLQQDAVVAKKKNCDKHVSTLESILKAYDKGLTNSLKQLDTAVLYSEKSGNKKKGGVANADLGSIPRPFLVSVCNSIGMFHRFIPAVGLRFLLTDYLRKIHESDGVLLKSDLSKLNRDDLMEACSQRSLSLGDLNEVAMRKHLKDYLAVVSSPPLEAQRLVGSVPSKGSSAAAKAGPAGGGGAVPPPTPLYFNENNMRFALLGLNIVGSVREAQENKVLRALFGCSAKR